jgi:hypothetical protein
MNLISIAIDVMIVVAFVGKCFVGLTYEADG